LDSVSIDSVSGISSGNRVRLRLSVPLELSEDLSGRVASEQDGDTFVEIATRSAKILIGKTCSTQDIRNIISETVAKYGMRRADQSSLDLYRVMGLAQSCWITNHPGASQLPMEQLRKIALAVMNGCAEAARKSMALGSDQPKCLSWNRIVCLGPAASA